MTLTRRHFLRMAAGSVATGLGIGAAGTGYARFVEPRWLEVTRHSLHLRRLPDAFAGMTVAQISDIHFCHRLTPANFQAVIDTLALLQPDAIVITGDIVSDHEAGVEMIAECFPQLHAPEGVFAIMGNHDWERGGPAGTRTGMPIVHAMRQAGVQVLINEHTAWRRGGQSLYLAGVDSAYVGRDDVAATLQGIPADAGAIVLAHEPDLADVVALDPRAILQLSGHSHGGQVCVPGMSPPYVPRLARKYPRGGYEIDDLVLYTNRGLGTVAWQLRFAARPEISLFTLQPLGPPA